MQIIVLGAGAIGSLFGAKLAANNDVTLIGRANHVAAINRDGLRIGGIETEIVRVHAGTAVEEIGPDVLILLTTKVSDTARALEPLARFVRNDTTILCLQNGLNSEEIARASVQNRGVVLRAITQAGAIFAGPGVIKFMARGYTLLEKHERSARIANIFNAADLDARISENIRADVWHKLVVNCVVNPITTMLGREVGAIADPQLDALKQLVIDECLAVAWAENIVLRNDFIREIAEAFAPSRNIVSMLQDLRRGRTTEIDYLNGAVVSLGQEHDIACPVNRALTAIIKAMEAQPSLFPKKMLESQLR